MGPRINEVWRPLTRHERFLQKLDEIWQEVVQKRSPKEWVKSRLQWEDWGSLGPEAVLYARQQLRRRRWRGALGGVAPRGYDAEDVAWECIEAMLEGESRIVAGWTRERLVKELRRLIRGKVRLLSSLKETLALRNEWDVAPKNGLGEAVSVLAKVAGEEKTGYDAAAEQEEGGESLRERIAAGLAREPVLAAVFEYLCEGKTQTREIAKGLGMAEGEVVRARRRLARRLREMGGRLKDGG